MNLLYLKYAVEIAACGSLNKAAEKLYIGQPNLSRTIKELEASLGVTIFERSPKGMVVTPDGEVFLQYARTILQEVESLEGMFKDRAAQKKKFSITVPRASYIGEAFAEFSKRLVLEDEVEVMYKETNSLNAMESVLNSDFKLGMIRYAENYDRYYKERMDEKGLAYELVTEFRHVVVMSADSPLAEKETILPSDLDDYIEIAHADPYVPSMPVSDVRKISTPEVGRRIFIFERGSQFDLLSNNPDTFMWVSPLPKKVLERDHLVQRRCDIDQKLYKDVMIYRREYHLTALDKLFISELCRVKREVFGSDIS